ncbi:DNA binding protein S1FA [Dillenia turbinata]|uniref:DNA binding protein S1FA n=1 Tax=Dillenia turbinata TaxID=194707 RepID=A0AAN8ZMY4_9MAGN
MDENGNVFINEAGAKGFNPGLIVLLVVGGLLLIFLVGNYLLFSYAQKTLPPRKKKPVSKKKMKRERLKQGVAPPGE